MKKRARTRERGAVFVEAIIVISVFIVFLLGTIYFRELYLAQVRSQRLARAGALAHAMSACGSDLRADLKADLPKGYELTQSKAKAAASDDDPKVEDSKGTNAGNTFTEVAEKERGGTIMNELDSVEIRGEASATTKPDPYGKETGFRDTVGSGSYVSCGDPLEPNPYEGIVELVPSLMGF